MVDDGVACNVEEGLQRVGFVSTWISYVLAVIERLAESGGRVRGIAGGLHGK